MLNQPLLILWTAFFGVIHEISAAPLPSEFTYVAFGSRTSDLPLATNTNVDTDLIWIVPIGTATGANPVTTYLYNEAIEDSDSGTFSVFGTIAASASGFSYSIVQWSVPTGTSSTLSPTAISTLAEECFYTNSFGGECVDPLHSTTFATGHAITGTLSESQAAFASTNPPTPTSSGKTSGKKSDAGAIAGGLFGGVLGITLIIVVIVFWLRRHRSEQKKPAPPPRSDNMSERNPLISLRRNDIHAIAREVAAVISRNHHPAETPEAEEIREVVDVTPEGKVRLQPPPDLGEVSPPQYQK